MTRRDTGRLGEKLAQDFLNRRGYEIIETNYRTRDGEVDVIARHKDTLVFIEVRAKKGLNFGTPEESITETKMAKLRLVAEHYRQTHTDLPAAWRIDVVAVMLDKDGRVRRINLIENAVED